ncbi:MAG: malate dehydrogenase [Candidatus Omnitrophica bacterium]|nr:malate dehydrogenase [Candidatus Omnitrophota bacterium]
MVKKISIIGSGAVGSNLAFHILSRLTIKELVLIDIVDSLAKGVSLDLEDTRAFLNFNTEIIGGSDINLIKDSDIVVLTCGLVRKEGMSREDLLSTNRRIISEVSLKIKELAKSSIVIVVTNPLDLMTYEVNRVTRFNRKRIMGMGSSLDTARFVNLIYKETKVSTCDIEALVFGLHSKDMLPVLSLAKIKGYSLERFIEERKLDVLKRRVKERGTEIVNYLKNRSAYFSPSLACYHLVEAIVNDCNRIIPVSVLLKGEFGLNNVCIGVPCFINRKGIDKIIEYELTPQEKRELLSMGDRFKECMK